MRQHIMATSEHELKQNLAKRHQRGRIGEIIFFASNIISLIALIVLFLHVMNSSFGYVIIENRVDPATLADVPLETLSETELAQIFYDNAVNRVLVFIRDKI